MTDSHRPHASDVGRADRTEQSGGLEADSVELRGVDGTLEQVPGYRKPAGFSRRGELSADAIVGTVPRRGIAEAVIGIDDRVRVPRVATYPWRAICALRIDSLSGKQYLGTGWLVGPKTVVTAGHCVYMHDDGGWAKRITVIPALSGSQEPYGRFTSSRLRSVEGWISKESTNADYGAILLNTAVNPSIGYFALGVLSDVELLAVDANISGYPADRDDARYQYYHARKIVRPGVEKLYYDIDTFGGQSGSPIWLDLGARGRTAIGVHTTGSTRGNSGTRITAEVLRNVRAWKAES